MLTSISNHHYILPFPLNSLIPPRSMKNSPFKTFHAIQSARLRIDQSSHTRQQNTAFLLKLLASLLIPQSHKPSFRIFLPCRSSPTGVQLHVTFEIKFLCDRVDVRQDFCSFGKELRKGGVGEEGDAVEDCGDVDAATGICTWSM